MKYHHVTKHKDSLHGWVLNMNVEKTVVNQEDITEEDLMEQDPLEVGTLASNESELITIKEELDGNEKIVYPIDKNIKIRDFNLGSIEVSNVPMNPEETVVWKEEITEDDPLLEKIKEEHKGVKIEDVDPLNIDQEPQRSSATNTINDETTGPKTVKDIIKCTYCNFQGLASQMELHKKCNHWYACYQCEFVTYEISHLNQHKECKHKNPTKRVPDIIQCSICKVQVWGIERHMKSKHWYPCNQCDFVTHENIELKNHKECKHESLVKIPDT